MWERKLKLDWLFTKCGSENWSLFGYLQSVGAKTGACLAIYKVWERKLELDWLFTKCGSENWSLIGYLQSVGTEMELQSYMNSAFVRKRRSVYLKYLLQEY